MQQVHGDVGRHGKKLDEGYVQMSGMFMLCAQASGNADVDRQTVDSTQQGCQPVHKWPMNCARIRLIDAKQTQSHGNRS
jgi:hypothetical protein